MKKSYADYLYKKTITDYNKISGDFSNKRSYLSSDLIELKKYTKAGNKVLDLGCGNGRLIEIFEDIKVDYIGTDNSAGLLDQAKEKYPKNDFVLLSSLKLPFPDNSFDLIFCLAVLHHIPSQDMRLKFLEEARRMLKPGGKIILTVWDLKSVKDAKNQIIKNKILRILHLTELDSGDLFYPFRNTNGKAIINRYIHAFTKTELEELFSKAKFKIIESKISERGYKRKNKNIFVVAEK